MTLLICCISSELQISHLCNGCDKKDFVNCQCCQGVLYMALHIFLGLCCSKDSHSLFEKRQFQITGRKADKWWKFVFGFIVNLQFVSFQVDTGNAGRVLASDAAVFLKKSGLPDLILGKVVFVHYSKIIMNI